MVDDRAVRFQGVRPSPRPAQPHTVEEAMRGTDPRMGYSRADQDLAERRGGEMFLSPVSTLLDEAKNLGVVRRGTPISAGLTAGAFLADLLNPAGLVAGGAVGKGIQTGVRAATLNPGAREIYLNSILGRLYHGAKQTPPAVLNNRGPQPQNWFDADTFLTTSKPLARTYMGGPQELYRARVPYEVAKNLDVMDLYRSPDEFVRLAESPTVLSQLADAGANTVKYQSGHGAGLGGVTASINKPVYALTEPAGIQMSRVGNTGYYTPAEQLRMLGGRVQRGFQDFLDQFLKRGAYDPENVL